MPRPVILGVVGDSAAGKTTITRGLVRVLGEQNVSHICTDDYHKYDRRERTQRLVPAPPRCLDRAHSPRESTALEARCTSPASL